MARHVCARLAYTLSLGPLLLVRLLVLPMRMTETPRAPVHSMTDTNAAMMALRFIIRDPADSRPRVKIKALRCTGFCFKLITPAALCKKLKDLALFAEDLKQL